MNKILFLLVASFLFFGCLSFEEFVSSIPTDIPTDFSDEQLVQKGDGRVSLKPGQAIVADNGVIIYFHEFRTTPVFRVPSSAPGETAKGAIESEEPTVVIFYYVPDTEDQKLFEEIYGKSGRGQPDQISSEQIQKAFEKNLSKEEYKALNVVLGHMYSTEIEPHLKELNEKAKKMKSLAEEIQKNGYGRVYGTNYTITSEYDKKYGVNHFYAWVDFRLFEIDVKNQTIDVSVKSYNTDPIFLSPGRDGIYNVKIGDLVKSKNDYIFSIQDLSIHSNGDFLKILFEKGSLQYIEGRSWVSDVDPDTGIPGKIFARNIDEDRTLFINSYDMQENIFPKPFLQRIQQTDFVDNRPPIEFYDKTTPYVDIQLLSVKEDAAKVLVRSLPSTDYQLACENVNFDCDLKITDNDYQVFTEYFSGLSLPISIEKVLELTGSRREENKENVCAPRGAFASYLWMNEFDEIPQNTLNEIKTKIKTCEDEYFGSLVIKTSIYKKVTEKGEEITLRVPLEGVLAEVVSNDLTSWSCTSNENGICFIDNFKPGTYANLSIQKPGCQQQAEKPFIVESSRNFEHYSVENPFRKTREAGKFLNTTLLCGNDLTPNSGTLTVQVTEKDAQGNATDVPIENANIELFSGDELSEVWDCVTNEKGKCKMENVQERNHHRILVYKQGCQQEEDIGFKVSELPKTISFSLTCNGEA